eukprot:TRINITY_DN2785_c0_g1_i1.p1 TRINITY_DN2785_c0_g1~~TRINITY_DN2785_c0_g1_i1.p1  ORF type:complete len:157 (-),score=5.82 TRINITY_DN2785_c0_g1_i1:387-857(-)
MIPFNVEKYIEYCQATQQRWMLYGYITTTNLFNQVTQMLARSEVVKEIRLEFHRLETPLQTEYIRSLVAALRANSSLISLDLRGKSNCHFCLFGPYYTLCAKFPRARFLPVYDFQKELKASDLGFANCYQQPELNGLRNYYADSDHEDMDISSFDL